MFVLFKKITVNVHKKKGTAVQAYKKMDINITQL